MLNWETYKQRKQPLIVFINEVNNIVIAHETIKYANDNQVSIRDSLLNVITSLQFYPYTIENKTKDVLSLGEDVLNKEMIEFENYLKTNNANYRWVSYSNLNGRSSVVQYRIGNDYIDVVFSSALKNYYHYSYKVTGIHTTELLKQLAVQGRYLGTNTRKIQRGSFEIHSL